MEIWDQILKSADVITSWPVIVLVIALVYKSSIAAALKRLSRYKGFGQELEFGRELAELEATPNPDVDASSAPSSGSVSEVPERDGGRDANEDLARRAEEEPSFIILSSWEDLSRLVRDLANALRPNSRMDPSGAMATLRDAHVVSSGLVDRYESLRVLRNQVAHGQHRPTPGEAITYAGLVHRLRSLIASYARHPSKQLIWEGREAERDRVLG